MQVPYLGLLGSGLCGPLLVQRKCWWSHQSCQTDSARQTQVETRWGGQPAEESQDSLPGCWSHNGHNRDTWNQRTSAADPHSDFLTQEIWAAGRDGERRVRYCTTSQHLCMQISHHRLATAWEWCYTISGWMVSSCKLCHYGNNLCRLVLAMFLGLCYFYSFGCIYDSTWK